MDLIDQLVADWGRVRPDLGLEAMQVVGRILRLGRRFQDETNALLRRHGLDYSAFDVLATLCRHGAPHALSPSDLRAAVLLSSGAMTACLNRLERDGLIERRPGTADRRKRFVYLTETGLALVEGLAAPRFQLAEQQARALDQTAQRRLVELLRQLDR